MAIDEIVAHSSGNAISCCSPAEAVHDYLSVVNHKQHILERAHLGEEIAFDDYQVSLESLLDRACALFDPKALGCNRRRGFDRLHRRHPDLYQLEYFVRHTPAT